MKSQALQYTPSRGWSTRLPAQLDSPSTLVLAFGAVGLTLSEGPLAELRAAFPASRLLGCSTAGEIFDTKVSDDTLSVAILQFEHSAVRSVCAEIGAGSYDTGRELAAALGDSPQPLQGVFVLSDGLRINGSELVRGITAGVGPRVVVAGGLAADGDRFGRTWVVHNDRQSSGLVCAIGLYGAHARIACGSKGGWDMFGPERVVTRSEANVLYEVDGRPALQLYKEYLGDRAAGLPATALLFPLALRGCSDEDKRIVRTVLAVDEAAQSMTFAGDIPQGSLAQLMRANFERLIQGASDAASLLDLKAGGDDAVAIAISCVGRRLVLGQRTEEETEATFEAFPTGTRQVGFYSYGEISPHTDGTCDLHNQTMTLTVMGEV